MGRELLLIVGAIVLLLFGGIFYLIGFMDGLKHGYQIGLNESKNITVHSTGILNMTCSVYPDERAMCCSPVEIISGRRWAYKAPSGFNATYLCQYNLTSGKFVNCTQIG